MKKFSLLSLLFPNIQLPKTKSAVAPETKSQAPHVIEIATFDRFKEKRGEQAGRRRKRFLVYLRELRPREAGDAR